MVDPIFKSLAPGVGMIERTPGRTGEPLSEEYGYYHCGPAGAGHFVKMVHNGIEYGLMAAYAEGLNILHHANFGKQQQVHDAETAPVPGADATTPTTSTSRRSPRSGGVAAWRLVAARPDRDRTRGVPRAGGGPRTALGLGRGTLDG